MRHRQLNIDQQILFPTTSDMPITEAKPNECGVYDQKAHGVKKITYKAKNLSWDFRILRLSESEFIFNHHFSMETGSFHTSVSPLSCHFKRWSYCKTEQDSFDKAIHRIKYHLNCSKISSVAEAERRAARVGLKWLEKQLNDNSLI